MNNKLLWLVGISLYVFTAVTPVYGGTNSWTIVGPEGGTVFSIAFHPSSAGIVLAGTTSGIHRSTDSGQHWTPINDPLLNAPNRIVFDPSASQRVFAASGQLYRSDDGGLTFGVTGAALDDGNLTVIALAANGSVMYGGTFPGNVYVSTDLGVQWSLLSTGLPGQGQGQIVDLTVDPNNADIAYAIAYGHGLYKTIDRGLSWSSISTAGAVASAAGQRVAIDPANSDHVLYATSSALYASTDGGQNWMMAVAGNVLWVGFDPSSPSNIVAALYMQSSVRSTDGGQTWSSGGTLPYVTNGAFDPLHAGHLAIAAYSGIFFSDNLAASFDTRVSGVHAGTAISLAATSDASGTVYAGFYPGPAGVFRRSANIWANAGLLSLQNASGFLVPNPVALAVDPNDSQIVYAAENAGILKTTNGGATWFKPSSALDWQALRDVVVSPADSQVVYVSTELSGVYKSLNGGATWSAASSGLPTAIGPMAIDPANANVIYAAGALSPNGIFKTVNGGLTWTATGSIASGLQVMKFAIDPTNSAVVYAAAVGGLLKSTNGGTTWTPLGGTAAAFSILIDPVVPTNLTMVNAPDEFGARRSIDGGATWERLPFTKTGSLHTFTKAILDPLNPSKILAGAERLGLVEFDVASDLAVSMDVPAVLPAGLPFSFAITANNQGPYAASDVRASVALPAQFTVSSVSPSQGSCQTAGTSIQCNFGVLRNAAAAKADVTLMVPSATHAGALTVSVDGHESDSNAANDSVSANISSGEVTDMTVALATSATSVNRNDRLTVTAIVTNHGPSTATSSQTQIQLPSGLTVQSASSNSGSCNASGGTVTCSPTAMASNASVTISIEVQASASGSQAISAQVLNGGTDPDATDNSATATVSVREPAEDGGSGGGGGSLDAQLLLLLGLAHLLLARNAGHFFSNSSDSGRKRVPYL